MKHIKINNITLIGMAGAGKTSVGKKLAGKTGFRFLDTDKYIETKERKKIPLLIEEKGDSGFKAIEEKRIAELNLSKHIISSGGSVVLSSKIMAHLKQSSLIAFLDVPFDTINKRLSKDNSRSIIGAATNSLKEIFDLRIPLYRRYADMIIPAKDETPEEIADFIIKKTMCIA